MLPIQGSNTYYEAVARAMGGLGAVRDFYRYFPVPGLSHCAGSGAAEGRPGISPSADPPLPQLVPDNTFYLKLIDWVEQGQPPETVQAVNSIGTNERPLCAYPRKLYFMGGDTRDASNYGSS